MRKITKRSRPSKSHRNTIFQKIVFLSQRSQRSKHLILFEKWWVEPIGYCVAASLHPTLAILWVLINRKVLLMMKMNTKKKIFAIAIIFSGVFAIAAQTATAKSVVVYTDNRTYHLGDEDFQSRKWKSLHGECYTASFEVPFSTRSLILKLQTYGAEAQNSILLNGDWVSTLPPQGLKKPNKWTGTRSVYIALDSSIDGYNALKICAARVKFPEFSGDKDDFQIRKIRIIVK